LFRYTTDEYNPISAEIWAYHATRYLIMSSCEADLNVYYDTTGVYATDTSILLPSSLTDRS